MTPRVRGAARAALVALLPALLLVFPAAFQGDHGPYFLGVNADPEYCYLFNSLDLLYGHTPEHFDHPGTTVQLLGAATLSADSLARRLGGDVMPVAERTVRDPERALLAIRSVLDAVVFLAAVLASLALLRATGRTLPVLVLQAALLVPLQLRLATLHVTPEPLLVAAVLLLAAALASYLGAVEAGRPARRWALLAGLALGLALATKVTALPLLLLLLLFPRGDALRAAAACLLAAVAFTLPVSGRYVEMAGWFLALAAHRGGYGTGPVGLPSLATLAGNATGLFLVEPALFVLLALGVAVLLWRSSAGRLARTGSWDRLLLLGLLAGAAQVVLTAKHPGEFRMGAHYLTPSLALAPLLAVAACELACRRPDGSTSRAAASVAGLLLAAGLVHAVLSTRAWVEEARVYSRTELAFSRTVSSARGCRVVSHFRASSLPYALVYGDAYAGGHFRELLRAVHPEPRFYDVWARAFYDNAGPVPVRLLRAELERGACLLMLGAPLERELANPRLVLTPLARTPRSAVYRLTRIEGDDPEEAGQGGPSSSVDQLRQLGRAPSGTPASRPR